MEDEDDAVFAGTIFVGIFVALGHCDHGLFYVVSSCAFLYFTCVLPSPTYEVTEVVAWGIDYMNLDPVDEIWRDSIFSGLVAIAGWIFTLICSRTLWRYSPFLGVLLYVTSLSLVLKDTGSRSVAGRAVILCFVVLLSLASPHISRIHFAASIALALRPLVDTDPVAEIILCIQLGFLSQLFHDIASLIVGALELFRLIYVVSVVMVMAICITSPGDLLYPANGQQLYHMAVTTPYERKSVSVLAFCYCLSYSTLMSIRFLVSPGYQWVIRRTVYAVMAFVYTSLVGIVAISSFPEYGHSIEPKQPIVMLSLTTVVFMLLSDAVSSAVSHSSYKLVYFRDVFTEDIMKNSTLFKSQQTPDLPFLIPSGEDYVIIELEAHRQICEKEYRGLSNTLVNTKRVYKAVPGNKDPVLLSRIARLCVQMAIANSVNALVLEKIAQRLREICADAEVEFELLSKANHFCRSNRLKNVALSRQVENSNISFAHAKRDLEIGEINAENCLENAQQDILAAFQSLRTCRVVTSGKKDRQELMAQGCRLIGKVDPLVMDKKKMQRLLALIEEAPVQQLVVESPYQKAVVDKHGPEVLAAEQFGPEIPSPSSSQRNKWWQVFRKKKMAQLEDANRSNRNLSRSKSSRIKNTASSPKT